MPALCQRPASPSRAKLRRELGGRGVQRASSGLFPGAREFTEDPQHAGQAGRPGTAFAIGDGLPSLRVGEALCCWLQGSGHSPPRRVDGHRGASSSPACEDAGAARGQLWPAGRLRFQGRQVGSPTPTLGRSGSWLLKDGVTGMHAATQADVASHGGRLRPRGPSGTAGRLAPGQPEHTPGSALPPLNPSAPQKQRCSGKNASAAVTG